MYLIKWIEDGMEKSYNAEGWIECDVIEERLSDENIEYVKELL